MTPTTLKEIFTIDPVEAQSLMALLTQRESEIVKLAAQGFKMRQIGARLFISQKTVESHYHSVRSKFRGVEPKVVYFCAAVYGANGKK